MPKMPKIYARSGAALRVIFKKSEKFFMKNLEVTKSRCILAVRKFIDNVERLAR